MLPKVVKQNEVHVEHELFMFMSSSSVNGLIILDNNYLHIVCII